MSRPYCFLHIPRTAGTTLNLILRDHFGPEAILSLYTASEFSSNREVAVADLDSVRLFQGHLLLERYDPPRLYGRDVDVFTFLREPVARLVSEYVFLKTWPHSHMYQIVNGMSFRDYIVGEHKHVRFKGKNFMTRVLSGRSVDGQGQAASALSAAKINLERVFGFFGIQEFFDESLILLARYLGLHKYCYEKRNALRSGYAVELTDADHEVALEFNTADVELYAFAKALLQERISAGGAALALELERFRRINASYQKVCAMISDRIGLDPGGNIHLPKA